MADVKISQLPAATTPLDGTELTPIVQSGTTKRVSVANLTVGRALTASSLTLSMPLSAANGGTGLTSLGTGIATFLGTPTSANLAAAVTDETGTGALVFGTTPTFTTSALFPAGTVSAPGISVSGDTNTGIYFPAADTIGFVEGGVEAMRLDANGNLGLGGTANERVGIFSSTINCYQQFVDSSNGGTTGAFGFFIGITNGEGQIRNKQNSPVTFYTNNAERMRLGSNGNLAIGDTDTSQKRLLVVETNNTTGVTYGLKVGNYSFTTDTRAGIVFINADNNGAAIWSRRTGGLEGSLVFGTNGGGGIAESNIAERMRIDASGNLLVGTTSSTVVSASSGTGMVYRPAIELAVARASATDAPCYVANITSYTSGTVTFFQFNRNGSAVGSIKYDGTNTTYNATSDVRLKENITDAQSALSSIVSIPIRQFDWKSGGHTEYGFVAQEANDYAPEIVSEGDIWSVDYGRITPRLIKAFQELAAEVAMLKGQING